MSIHLVAGSRDQYTFLVGQKTNLHELIVPSNALWDVGFSDTDRLQTNIERESNNQLCEESR